MKKYIIALGLFAQLAFVYGQATIKRQVIGSLGINHVQIGSTNYVSAATVGQPPNAGTITNGTNCLRQGFQQPPNDENCAIQISYDLSTVSVPGCGTYYVFEYTGTITPTTDISWNFGSDASPSIATGPVSPNIAFFDKGAQEIIITVSDGTCMKSISTMIDAQTPPFYVQTQVDQALCFGEKGTINLVPTNGTPPYLVNWSNSAVTEDLINIDPGVYAYTVTDQKGCIGEGSITVIGSTEPLIVKSNVMSELCHDTNDGSISLTILNGADPITYLWEDGNTEPERMNLDSGTYKVMITDVFGCVIDTSFRVTTFCEQSEEDFIPDTFSPNGDAANELWEIPILSRFPDHVVNIYNRWGSLIWDAKGNFTGWDGTNTQGEKMDIGAFFYVIELNDADKRVYKGSVTLIR